MMPTRHANPSDVKSKFQHNRLTSSGLQNESRRDGINRYASFWLHFAYQPYRKCRPFCTYLGSRERLTAIHKTVGNFVFYSPYCTGLVLYYLEMLTFQIELPMLGSRTASGMGFGSAGHYPENK